LALNSSHRAARSSFANNLQRPYLVVDPRFPNTSTKLERSRRADVARKACMARLALKSAQARRRKERRPTTTPGG
jgi:hypothetical protein